MAVTLRSWVPTVAYDSDATNAGRANGNGLDGEDLSAYSNSGSSSEEIRILLPFVLVNTATRINVTSQANAYPGHQGS